MSVLKLLCEKNSLKFVDEMQQDGGASSLEQFKLLAKTACGRACVALIQQVLGSKNVYVFGELLEMPNVVALQGTEHEPYFDLLQLFARGTYAEYKSRSFIY